MAFGKKDVRKIQKASAEELKKLHEEYDALMGGVRGLSPVGLLLIAVAGVALILSFRSNVIDFVGLILVLYPLYIFIQRGAHKEGYLEGYYDLLTKGGGHSGKSQ